MHRVGTPRSQWVHSLIAVGVLCWLRCWSRYVPDVGLLCILFRASRKGFNMSVMIFCPSLYFGHIWRKLAGFLRNWQILELDGYFHSCCISWGYLVIRVVEVAQLTSIVDVSVVSTFGKAVANFGAFSTSLTRGCTFLPWLFEIAPVDGRRKL